MDETTGADVLRSRICPWLRAPFDRLAAAHAEGRLGHAWLIAGPAGIGKINLALALADRLLRGANAGELGTLDRRSAVAALATRHAPTDHHPDLHWLHPEEDKASISVEQVRGIIEALGLTAHGGGTKVVVVEPAEAMTIAASNALLKTLEEPSADTFLLLLCHQPGRLPATIRSRCQRLTVRGPRLEACREWFEGVSPAELAAAWQAGGGTPLATAALLNSPSNISALEDDIEAISRDTANVQDTAARWAKDAPRVALGWLLRRLHREIRARFHAAQGSTPVTDRQPGILHNPYAALSLRALFEQYDRTERLLGQLDSGINLELALQALLIGFQVNRGRP